MRNLADVAAGLRRLMSPTPAAAGQPEEAAPPPPLGGLAYRPTLYARHAVCWVALRAWRADCRLADLAAFKRVKADPDAHRHVIEAAAQEIAARARLLLGPLAGWSATSVACGHSRRPDCFGKRLGQAVADALAIPFEQVFEDRFVAGSSHPKEFRKLPSLAWHHQPAGPVLVIDDVATSGWHLEEALGRLRELGLPALGLVWISGTVT